MSVQNREVVVLNDIQAIAEEAARRFAEACSRAVSERGQFVVALSGGSTPKALYAVLSEPPYRDQVDWEHIQVFFSDERFVPPDAPQSNFHTAQEGLLSRVPIPERFTHQVPTVGIEPDSASTIYEEGIRRVFHGAPGETPAFDLIFLGMGPDGHTASLFPGTEALDVVDRLVAPNFVPQMDSWRITFTFPLIDAARQVLFLVAGADKAEAAGKILSGQADLPAARVRADNGQVTWLIDRAASAESGPG